MLASAMESRCCVCHKTLTPHQSLGRYVLPCGHSSCSDCYANHMNFISVTGVSIDSGVNPAKCALCSYKDGADEPPTTMASTPTPYRPLMNQQQAQSLLQPNDAFLDFTSVQRSQNDYLNSVPPFVPQDPHLLYSTFGVLPQVSNTLDKGGKSISGAENKGHAEQQFPDNHGTILEKNLNAVHIDLKARVSDVFGQIIQAVSAQQETINNALDEKFADIGERLSGQKDIKTDITAEVYKVTEEINAELAEAKLMIDVINSLKGKKALSAFVNYMSSAESGSSTSPGPGLSPVTDTTLSKPMIRSWSDSTSQSAVLITWTTPRDFELLHRSEGFWYELEQRLASEPETAWRNVYKGVERTFVCKNMRRGTKYLFRCCVCVARHRYSHWSPEVLIVPGTGYPDGKQNLVAPEISKALEQEVARTFTSGAVNAAGSSSPAVVTTVIVPINSNHSSSSPALPMSDSRSTSPATASLSPSPTMQSTNPGGKAQVTNVSLDSSVPSAAAVSAAVSAVQMCDRGTSVTEAEPAKGKKQRNLPPNWNTFIPGPFYELGQSNRVATALQPNAIVVGHPFPKSCNVFISIQILSGSGVFFGVAPSGINQSVIQQHLYQGWFLETSTLSIGSRPPYKWKAKPAYLKNELSKPNRVYFPHEGDIITMNYNSKTNCLRFSTLPGTYLSGKYTSLISPSNRVPLVPVVVLANTGDTVLLQSAVQCSF